MGSVVDFKAARNDEKLFLITRQNNKKTLNDGVKFATNSTSEDNKEFLDETFENDNGATL